MLEKYENKEQKEVVEESDPSMHLVDCVKKEPVDVQRIEVVPNEDSDVNSTIQMVKNNS